MSNLSKYRLWAMTCVSALLAVHNAVADPVTFFVTIADGRSQFDDQITAVGETSNTDLLSGLASGASSWSQSGYTIISSDGSNRSVLSPFATAATGQAIRMTAYSTGLTVPDFDETAEWDNPPSAAFDDGVSFTFASPINAFGFELQGWATCCLPSSLYLQFDGGTPIRVGTGVATDGDAATSGDAKTAGPTIYRANGVNYEVFIGAVDDSGTFATISFFGVATGGDALLSGGTIRYALIPVGSISNPSDYTSLSDQTSLSQLGRYFGDHDDSGERQTVAASLNAMNQEQVVAALKRIFPVDRPSSLAAGALMGGQAVRLAFDRAGTRLGHLPGAGAGEEGLRPSFARRQRIARAAQAGPDLPHALEQVQLPAFELTSASEVSDLAFQLSATPYQAFQSGRHGFWIEGLGSHADGESTGTTAGYEINRYGVVAGYEHAIDATLLAGVIASMSTAKLALDGSAGDTDVNSYTIGAYGQNRLDQWRLTAAVNLGYGDYDSERNIQVGAVNAVARSNYDGLSYAATVGASRLYTEGRGKIEPYIRLTLEGAWTEKHDEDGAGEFDMVVDDDHLLLGTAELGVILAYEPDLDAPSGEFKLKPFIRQQIELEDSDVSVRFADASTSVAVDGRNQDLTEAGVVAEISVDLTDQAGFHLGGSASVDRYEVDYGGFVRLSFDW